MRLINTSTFELENFVSHTSVPAYAVLSHTWGDEELTLKEYSSLGSHEKAGFQKIRYTCDEARENGIPYAWVDTVCIDKESSAELSEAINSMWTWYKKAKICYAYLSDVLVEDIAELNEKHHVKARTSYNLDNAILPDSRWVTRGWTLQELLAPREVEFYTMEWYQFGTRTTLAHALSHHTRIDVDILQGRTDIQTASVAKRMSWASGRSTTRLEDAAYCLLGIFDVNMPLLYGEGEKAFIRLQEEILRFSDDESIFAWMDPDASIYDTCGLLAPSPSMFRESAEIMTYRDWSRRPVPASVNSIGITLLVQLQAHQRNYAAQIRCRREFTGTNVALCVKRISQESGQYCRISPNILLDWQSGPTGTDPESISIRQKPVEPALQDILASDKWLCRRVEPKVSGRYIYRVIHSFNRQGRTSSGMDAILTIPGEINELCHIFVVTSEIGNAKFLVLVGSGRAFNRQKTGRMGAFEVRDFASVGLANEADITRVVSYREVIAAAFQPEHYFDETVFFRRVHHVTIAISTERLTGLPCCHLILKYQEPEVVPANAGEQSGQGHLKPSFFEKMLQRNKSHDSMNPRP